MEEDIVIPDFKLPELPEIGKNSKSVFVDTEEGKKVRPLTSEEKVNLYATNRGVDLTRKIGEYSYNDTRLFTDPSIKFQPGADMESIYAEANPFTLGDAFGKAWDTLRINAFSSYTELYYGIKEGITDGDISKVFNNSQVKYLADLTESLEVIKPQFRTLDERENPFSVRNWDSTIKTVLPSFGFAGAGILDAVSLPIVTGIVTGGLTITEGGLPGAIAGVGIGLAKSVSTVKNIVTGLWTLSKNIGNASKAASAIKAAATTANVLNVSKLAGSALFFANSEAALQGELNAREAKKTLQENNFKATGNYLSEEELDKQTLGIQRSTYLLNLPLLAASAAFQMPNLLRGKLGPSILQRLPVKALADRTLKPQNVALFLTKEWAKDTIAEGAEEVAQKGIDNVTKDYYMNGADRSFTNSLINGTYKTLTDDGVALEFFGGAFSGGIMNSRKFLSYGKTKRAVESAISIFNTSTNELVNNFSRTSKSHTALKNALIAGDMDTVKKINRDNLIDIIETGRYLGSVDAKREILKDISNMSLADFNIFTEFNVDEDTKNLYTTDLLSEYDRINSLLNKRDSVFAYNPFMEEKWFKERAKQLEPVFGQKANVVANKMYEDSKRILGKMLVHNEEVGTELEKLELSRPELSSWYSDNLDATVSHKVANLKSLNLPSDQALIRYLDGKSMAEQAHILSKAEGLTDTDRAFLGEVYKNRTAKKIYEERFKKYSTKEGHKRLLKEISYYMEYLYKSPDATPVTPATPVVPTVPVTPTVPVATVTPSPASPVTPIPTPTVVTPASPAPASPVVVTPIPIAPIAPIVPTTPAAEDIVYEEILPDPDDLVMSKDALDEMLFGKKPETDKVQDLISNIADLAYKNGPQRVFVNSNSYPDTFIAKTSTNSLDGMKYLKNGNPSSLREFTDFIHEAVINGMKVETEKQTAEEFVTEKLQEEDSKSDILRFLGEDYEGLENILVDMQDSKLIKINC